MLLLAYTGQSSFLLALGDLTDPQNPSLCFSIAHDGRPPYTTYLANPQPVPSCAAEGFVGLHGGTAGPAGVSACERHCAVVRDLVVLMLRRTAVHQVFWFTSAGDFGSGQYKAMLAVATLASIVASQALISGVFTAFHQAAVSGLFPFIQTKHTSMLVRITACCCSIHLTFLTV